MSQQQQQPREQNAVSMFRQQYDKLRRSLDSSMQREELYLDRIRELEDALKRSNDRLHERTLVMEVLEKKLALAEQEKKRATQTAMYATDRETNLKSLVSDLRTQLQSLQIEIQKMSITPERPQENSNARSHSKLNKSALSDSDVPSFKKWKNNNNIVSVTDGKSSPKRFQKGAMPSISTIDSGESDWPSLQTPMQRAEKAARNSIKSPQANTR